MKKPARHHRIQSMTFTRSQREEHVARQLAPNDEEKQARLRMMPLFDVAVRGGDAIKPWGKR